MLVSGIASRPQYKPLSLDPAARSHLIVADHPQMPGDFLSPASLGRTPIQLWSVVGTANVATAPRHRDLTVVWRSFRSVPQLLECLAHHLAREHVGFRLYAIGLESFAWDVAKLAASFGLDRSEYYLTHQGSEKRRVYCVHCRSFTENVTNNIVSCCGCGAHLLVRDHFSRRLAAFMGVMVNAELPYEIPLAEETFP